MVLPQNNLCSVTNSGNIRQHEHCRLKKKMEPTNPNAHTHVDDTDVQTHFAKQKFPFQYKVSKINCEEWSLKDKVLSVEWEVCSVKRRV